MHDPLNPVPEPPVVELEESCRCGASTTAKGPSEFVRAHLDQWRKSHPCTSREDEELRHRSGSGTAFLGGPPGARIGFGAAPEVRGPIRWGRLYDADDAR